MIFIIDSNVFFSALIKDSATRKIIFELEGTFLFPEYLFEEFKEHLVEIINKSKLPTIDFYELVRSILKKVKIVKNDVLFDYGQEALKIMKNIDKEDSLIVACALAHSGSVIWTEDKHFRKQNKIGIVNTNELMKKLDNQKIF